MKEKITNYNNAMTTVMNKHAPVITKTIRIVPLNMQIYEGNKGKQKGGSEKQVMRNMKMNITNFEIKQHYWHSPKRNHI